MSNLNKSFLNFFKELSKNNSKEWFDENRKTYEKEVKEPFKDLVEEMISRIQEYESEIQIKPSQAIMRINRDTRFSKDKTPYNTRVAANISKYGKKDKSYPGFFFELSHEGVSMFGGAYMVDKDTLHSLRALISNNMDEFSKTISDPSFKEKFGNIQGEQHKRIPKEFQDAVEKEPLIANKQFFYSTSLKPDIITSEHLPDKLIEYYLSAKKVNDFLKRAWTTQK